MSDEKQYTIQFNTQTLATCLTHAVEMAQAQVDNGNVYVTITEEGGEPWEFSSVQDVYGPRDRNSPTPKTDATVAAIKKHEFLHHVFVENLPEDRSGLPKEFDFLLNRFPPFQARVDHFDVDHFTQVSGKVKKRLAKLIKKAKRIKKRIKKGKRK